MDLASIRPTTARTPQSVSPARTGMTNIVSPAVALDKSTISRLGKPAAGTRVPTSSAIGPANRRVVDARDPKRAAARRPVPDRKAAEAHGRGCHPVQRPRIDAATIQQAHRDGVLLGDRALEHGGPLHARRRVCEPERRRRSQDEALEPAPGHRVEATTRFVHQLFHVLAERRNGALQRLRRGAERVQPGDGLVERRRRGLLVDSRAAFRARSRACAPSSSSGRGSRLSWAGARASRSRTTRRSRAG